MGNTRAKQGLLIEKLFKQKEGGLADAGGKMGQHSHFSVIRRDNSMGRTK